MKIKPEPPDNVNMNDICDNITYLNINDDESKKLVKKKLHDIQILNNYKIEENICNKFPPYAKKNASFEQSYNIKDENVNESNVKEEETKEVETTKVDLDKVKVETSKLIPYKKINNKEDICSKIEKEEVQLNEVSPGTPGKDDLEKNKLVPYKKKSSENLQCNETTSKEKPGLVPYEKKKEQTNKKACKADPEKFGLKPNEKETKDNKASGGVLIEKGPIRANRQHRTPDFHPYTANPGEHCSVSRKHFSGGVMQDFFEEEQVLAMACSPEFLNFLEILVKDSGENPDSDPECTGMKPYRKLSTDTAYSSMSDQNSPKNSGEHFGNVLPENSGVRRFQPIRPKPNSWTQELCDKLDPQLKDKQIIKASLLSNDELFRIDNGKTIFHKLLGPGVKPEYFLEYFYALVHRMKDDRDKLRDLLNADPKFMDVLETKGSPWFQLIGNFLGEFFAQQKLTNGKMY